MTTDHLWHLLKTEFFYQSSRKRRFFVERFRSWATLIYYTQLFNIILAESLTAKYAL